MKNLENTEVFDAACERYIEILHDAIKRGHTEDPLMIVAFFLGLGIELNVLSLIHI